MKKFLYFYYFFLKQLAYKDFAVHCFYHALSKQKNFNMKFNAYILYSYQYEMVGSRYKTILVLTLFIFKSADVNVSNFHLLISPEALYFLHCKS